MGELVLAAAFLLVSHVGLSSAGLQTQLVETLGWRVFLILYSVVPLAWVIAAYGNVPFMEVQLQSPGTKQTLILLMSLVCILLVAGVTTVGATITNDGALPVGQEEGDSTTGILKATRHPVMWGFILRAEAHIPPNGDAAGLMLFGSFLALALARPLLIDAKQVRRHGICWERFSGSTSAIPFATIIGGRSRVRSAGGEFQADWRFMGSAHRP